jgi:hypothetical protein
MIENSGKSNGLIQILKQAVMPTTAVKTEDGGMEITFGKEPAPQPLFNDNLAEHIDDTDLTLLAADLIEDFENDRSSREEWEKTYINGLDLLGLKFEDREKPWDGACGVFHPMLTDSVVRFQSQTIQEIFPASGPVKVTVVGSLDKEKTKQSNRVAQYMNYVSTKKMVEYRNETEKLLFSLPIAGSAFKKIYFDPNLGRSCSMFVPAEDFVVSYGASDLSTAERATHVMKRTSNQVRKYQVSGFYRDIDLPSPEVEYTEIEKKYASMTGNAENHDLDQRHTLLEMSCNIDLVGFEDQQGGKKSGIALPYVVTIDKSSSEILSIYRNWLEDDQNKLKREHFVHYQYLPGFGFYGFGLLHMIGGLAKSATSLLRQLVDAGTLANMPGGLKTRGLRIKGDDAPILPGEFRDVDVPSGAIKDSIAFLPYKEPSSTLYQLLGDIVDEGRRFASAADVKAADMNGEAPVGTTLAILEREMKVLSAVQARVHDAMGKELVILAEIIKEFGPEDYPYEVKGNAKVKNDFDDRVDIIPVSDPNAGTMAQRIMQYQAALQLAAQAPQMYDMPLLHRQMLEILGIQEADKIVPTEDDMLPTDPVTEFENMLNGKPVKAFMYQDHEAHIQAHMASAKNPDIMAMLEQNPQAESIMAAGAAHLNEHVAFLYRKKIEEELGTHLPGPEEQLPEDIELRLSRLVAPAAEQLTGKAEQRKQAEENAKQSEDPIVQMAKQELDIKQKAAETKDKEVEGKLAIERQKAEAANRERMAKIAGDIQKALADNELEWERLEQEGLVEGGKLAAKIAADQMKAAGEEAALTSKEQLEGFRIGIKLAQSLIRGDNLND